MNDTLRKRPERKKKEKSKVSKTSFGTMKSFDPKTASADDMCFKVNEAGERVFDAKVGERVIVQRYNSCAEEKYDFDVGIIKAIEDDGTVKFWDETKEQWFFFDWTHDNIPLVFKVDEASIRKFSKRKRRSKVEEQREEGIAVMESLIGDEDE
jgi:hypothetical protein